MLHTARRLRRPFLAGGLSIAMLALIGAAFSDEDAAARDDVSVSSVATLVGDDTLDPRLLGLDLSGPRWAAAVAGLEEALFAREDAARRLATAREALRTIRSERATVGRAIEQHRDEAESLGGRIDAQEAALRDRALELYIGFGQGPDLDTLSSREAAADSSRLRHLTAEVEASQLELRRTLLERRDQVGGDLADLTAQLLALDHAEWVNRRAERQANADLEVARLAVAELTDSVRDARRSARVTGLDLSLVALDAYLRAEGLLGERDPGCGVRWWMVAAIARIESRHGELGGRSVLPDGSLSRPIIGIALDGGPRVRAVGDTDGGELDGDSVWDRAVGPMQFIPETWRRNGIDGNDDGLVDPQNIYDAAATTARYLCLLGGDLTLESGRDAAYFGYNTSDDYVATVQGHAERYRAFPLPALPGGAD